LHWLVGWYLSTTLTPLKMVEQKKKKSKERKGKGKKITFKDEDEVEVFYEPENFIQRNIRRCSIDQSQQQNSLDPQNLTWKNGERMGVGPGRYSMYISGMQQFDPYQELTSTQIAAFRQVFDMVDKDGGGSIDADELYGAMKDLEPSLKLKEIKEIIEELDHKGNGTIEFDEFLYMMTSMSIQINTAHTSSIAHDDFGRKRASVFFSCITQFAMRHSLKEIERYYASKSRHTPHVVAHYAAGACVEGLSEKELRQEWRHLLMASKGKDSPYAQPLNFYATTPQKNKSKKRNSRISPELLVRLGEFTPSPRYSRSPESVELNGDIASSQKKKKPTRARNSRISPELLRLTPSPNNRYSHLSSDRDSPDSVELTEEFMSSPCSSRAKSPGSSRPESRGWTPRHGLPITKVPLPMVIYNRNKNSVRRKKLTIIDMDRLRDRITVARNCYYNQLNLENEEKATKYWETLKINEIPSKRLRRYFLDVFRAYSPTNEYENHIVNEKNDKSQTKVYQQEGNSKSPVLLRL